MYRLKKQWRDGTSHVVFEPMELMERLAALVPAPRFNLVRYSGVLAPSAGWRSRIVPKAVDGAEEVKSGEGGTVTFPAKNASTLRNLGIESRFPLVQGRPCGGKSWHKGYFGCWGWTGQTRKCSLFVLSIANKGFVKFRTIT
jgi:hypothetical protein